jgi:hypothetical protein
MTTAASALSPALNIASTRTIRLAVGIALSLAFSQAIKWPGSFIAPVIASVILCLPQSAPTAKFALGFIVVIAASFLLGLLLLPMLHNQPAAGVLAISLGVFGCFYFGAKGGSPALVTFLLVGMTIVPAIGSESVDAAIGITWGLIVGAIVAFLFIWLAFIIIPDPPLGQQTAKPALKPPSAEAAAYSALRSTAIVLPALYWLFFTSETAAYAVILIKIATMAQQSSFEDSHSAGRDLLQSTLIGGIAAIAIWNILQIWPTVIIYSLLFLLCGLIMGPKIFAGAGLTPKGPVWSYGLLTMMIIVAPAVMDTAGGDGAGSRFSDRITMFVIATFYAVAAIYIFDLLWPLNRNNKEKLQHPPEAIRSNEEQ